MQPEDGNGLPPTPEQLGGGGGAQGLVRFVAPVWLNEHNQH